MKLTMNTKQKHFSLNQWWKDTTMAFPMWFVILFGISMVVNFVLLVCFIVYILHRF